MKTFGQQKRNVWNGYEIYKEERRVCGWGGVVLRGVNVYVELSWGYIYIGLWLWVLYLNSSYVLFQIYIYILNVITSF